MLIRSQDRKRIVNFDNVEKICVYERFEDITDDEPNIWSVETPTACLGQYTSEEKAIKVLDWMQLWYIISIANRDAGLSGNSVNRGQLERLNIPEYVRESMIVSFDMPQDDEVEV
ncbi:MAG: hypothetical protein QM793_03580 [Muricomes sp.]